MPEWNYSPTAVTVPRLILDPYRCGVDANAALDGADAGGRWGDEDWRVPPRARAGEESEEGARRAPEPSRRPSLSPADRRRLELHAALVRAGVAPEPGDLHAVEALSTLDDTVNDAVRRWIAAH
ncbi:hypothetical protein ACF09K_20095 [Streptomyces sp. NPDC014882]|uniref:hypothetical protein n=1 Tax=Streptomyces sp. NPDC014882 TaxID=3364927 RepID=UPI0036FD631C